jgi:predicted nucleic acid-binding protein
MAAPDGMIAAIARINGGRLATRTLPDFGQVSSRPVVALK